MVARGGLGRLLVACRQGDELAYVGGVGTGFLSSFAATVTGRLPTTGHSMRILLIEDDVNVSRSIELMLKSESFSVFTTELGEEGVNLGKLHDYDLILLVSICPICRATMS